MKAKKFNWILYLITATILTTIAVQLYWNYKNYQENKQRVLNEIQISLDKAIDDYYHTISKKNLLTIVEPDRLSEVNIEEKKKVWSEIFSGVGNKSNDSTKANVKITSVEVHASNPTDQHITDSIIVSDIFQRADTDYHEHIPEDEEIGGIIQLDNHKELGLHFKRDSVDRISNVQVFRGAKAQDSLKLIKGLKTMFIAIHNDSLAYADLDTLLSNELKEKKIDVQFAFKHFKNDTLYYDYKGARAKDEYIIIDAKSTFFKVNERLNMLHSNPSKVVLKRSSTGILLSLLLSLAVISSLFYLLKIINTQKELAEIKNDLISNITHEFKTPIATVATAVEALEHFNTANDKEKTKKYLNISSTQLNKLHGMVEKLLETATLDSEKLMLNKDRIDLVTFVEKLVHKHKLLANEKQISFSSNVESKLLLFDKFHFENAISNLIDNAIKYGGEIVQVNVNIVLNTSEITVADNGKGIEKGHLDKIFDKFYRVPKGNIHDVKGFGIGLYYSKKIIEKHGGKLQVTSALNETIFKVSLPNE